MKLVSHKIIFLLCLFFYIPFHAWSDDRPVIEGDLTIYMQMGGNSGGPATLARELGARDAARVLDVNLIEQHSDGIHKGCCNKLMKPSQQFQMQSLSWAIHNMTTFLQKAARDGVKVIVGNNNLPGSGRSYFGLDNYEAGVNLAKLTLQEGNLGQGDHIVVYGAFIQVN